MTAMLMVWLPDIKHPALSVSLSNACSQKLPTAAVDREGVRLGSGHNNNIYYNTFLYQETGVKSSTMLFVRLFIPPFM